MDPLVSILTPTYNHERFIGQCIESVLSQTYENWEMIVVDDGSTDRTEAVVRSYEDSRIHYVRRENTGIKGLRQTYNAGLEMAKGELIAILEGDDYWPAEKLDIQVPDFDDPNVVLSSGLTSVDTGSGSFGLTPVQMPPEDARNNRPVGRAALHMISPGSLTYTFPVSTVLRCSALRGIGGFQQPPYMLVVDFPTFLRLTVEGEFRFHDKVLGYWRRHISSVTLSRMSEIVEGAYRYAFEFLGEFRDRLPVSDQELDSIESKWDEQNAMACILRGRLLNKQGEKALAAKAFREASLFRTGKRTLQIARIAASLSDAGLSVDPIYRLLGRVPLDEATTLDTGDRTVSVDDMKRERVVGRWRG
jgi:glycosyltransferase involved in cell wall biosynthesis